MRERDEGLHVEREAEASGHTSVASGQHSKGSADQLIDGTNVQSVDRSIGRLVDRLADRRHG